MAAFHSSTPSPLEVTIIREDGEILYYRKSEIRYKNYQTLFDFSRMESGEYQVALTDEFKEHTFMVQK